MTKKLTDQQRKFLTYIKEEHNYLGWPTRIINILECGEYEIVTLLPVLRDWKEMCMYDNCPDCREFGRPVKYRNHKNINIKVNPPKL